MKIFDACIITEDVVGYEFAIKGSYAIIVDFFTEDVAYVEVWNFEINDAGAEMVPISVNSIRLATEEERLEYQKKFTDWAKKHELM